MPEPISREQRNALREQIAKHTTRFGVMVNGPFPPPLRCSDVLAVLDALDAAEADCRKWAGLAAEYQMLLHGEEGMDDCEHDAMTLTSVEFIGKRWVCDYCGQDRGPE